MRTTKSPGLNQALTLVFVLITGIFFIQACTWMGKKKSPETTVLNGKNNDKTMPALPLSGDYLLDWQRIDSLEQDGLYKSAQELTDALYARAKNDNNEQQQIRAIIYKAKYSLYLGESGTSSAIQVFEKEEKTAAQPMKSVLQSMLGELYANFLQLQGWEISGRTPIPDGEGGDILTWSAEQIEKKALELYLQSVTFPRLKEISADYLKGISIPGFNDSVGTVALRPTLYDFLANRALEHFSQGRAFITEPSYKFDIEQEAAFAPASDFVKTAFTTRDSTSGTWRSVQLFQEVLRWRLAQKDNQAALIDIDLLRLRFMYNNAVLENKSALYEKALTDQYNAHKDHPMSTEIVALLANYWFSQEKPENLNGNNPRQKALEWCKTAVQRFPDAFGAIQCRNQILEIERRAITSMEVEAVTVPEKPFLCHFSFKNIKKVYYRVIPVSQKSEELENLEYDQRLPKLLSMPMVQEGSADIADPGDWYDHQTEIRLNGVPTGHYVVILSGDKDFNIANSYVGYSFFRSSRLAFSSYIENDKITYIVADRSTGAPLPKVTAAFYRQVYDPSAGKYKLQFLSQGQTDEQGLVSRPANDNNENPQVWLTLGTDTLDAGGYYYYRYRDDRSNRQMELFSDRRIYRPGQTLYFKGILFQRNEKGYPTILPNEKVQVKLLDVNGQIKSTLDLKTNEYGSVQGTFALPSSGLTGLMSLQVGDEAIGSLQFNVEEYKRPKFEVQILPVQGAYRVNETIKVQGEAKAFAGSNVDGAEVRYRVIRRARFPFFYGGWSKRGGFPYEVEEMEITNGNTQTGTDGRFEVTFTAVPDKKVPKKAQPVFEYQVFADVTDINGETRSTSQIISVAYSALQVELALQNEQELQEMKKITLRTTNMNGQPQAASGQISLQRITAPSVLYKNRYWEKPDVWSIPENVFKQDFPTFAWKDEDNPENWAQEGPAVEIAFNTASDKPLDLHNGKLKAGYYRVRLTATDPYGEPVEIKRTIRIWDTQTPASRFTEPSAVFEKNTLEPGETMKILLGAQVKPAYMYLVAENEGNLAQGRWYPLNGSAEFTQKMVEEDRGGRFYHWFCILDNRVYAQTSMRLNVPWSNKDLQISFETFRDKLAPGQQEEWRLRISGPKKDKVAAELVAAMYDASLDQFAPNYWSRIGFPERGEKVRSNGYGPFNSNGGNMDYRGTVSESPVERRYRLLNWFNFPINNGVDYVVTFDPETYEEKVQIVRQDRMMFKETMAAPAARMEMDQVLQSVEAGNAMVPAGGQPVSEQAPPPPPPTPIRSNLNETVFFYPDLKTDANGDVVLKFKMNEALTRWKLMLYAHSKSLQEALATKEVVTQKDLMVLANPPRFLRAGDQFTFSAKVSNLSKEKQDGTATLSLLDANTLQPVEKLFGLDAARSVPFSVPAGQSAALTWSISIPTDYTGALTWQVFADGKKVRDGEESTLPVVTNRQLVTETLPITVRGGQQKTFTFEELKNGKSGSLQSHRYTLEFTSNPAWYVVQSLPYLMEYPYECSEQVFSRYYANALAAGVTAKMPAIRQVYDRWKGTDAMKSNLAKNQELKTALLEETPWVVEAQDEERQRQQIALLFDLNRMADEQQRALNTLAERQLSNGGWPWFAGGPDSWYITQYIAEGIGHLNHLGVAPLEADGMVRQMLDKALGYCDQQVQKHYADIERAVKEGKTRWEDNHLDPQIVHYLYTRSFFPLDRIDKISAYYLEQSERFWNVKGLYEQGLIALALHRNGRADAAARVVASLRERAQQKEELGMYWAFDWGYNWFQLPIETQALMVEVFDEVAKDTRAVEELRIWMLKNKQTNRWESTKATAAAVYALLLHGDNWLNNTSPLKVSAGGKTLDIKETEPGTGYFKQAWTGKDIKPALGDISVQNPNSNISWGAAYWQYFEDLDKIKSFKKTPLTIVKQLYREENSPSGPKLVPISEGARLRVGDQVKVRIEIRVDRPMEYVHLKDMRAAGFEPRNVLSGYRWQNGLGYYESTRDLATHFFIDYLPRGTFVFEYPLVVSHRGQMSNGITTMQCMYAPEFTSHSAGIRVQVD